MCVRCGSLKSCWLWRPSRYIMNNSALITGRPSSGLKSSRKLASTNSVPPSCPTAISRRLTTRISIRPERIATTFFTAASGKASEFSSIFSTWSRPTPSGIYQFCCIFLYLFSFVLNCLCFKIHLSLKVPVGFCQHYNRRRQRLKDCGGPLLRPADTSSTAGHAAQSGNPFRCQLRPPSQGLFGLVQLCR